MIDAVVLDVGHHEIALPFGHLPGIGPLDPAVTGGVEHRWVERGGFTLAQDARLGAWTQALTGTTASLGTDLLARATLAVGPTAEVGLGLGATTHWRARPVLAWDETEGTWTPANDPGQLGARGGFVLGLGMDLGRVTEVPLTVAVRYQWFGQTPFLPALPIGPESLLTLGLSWTLGGAS